MILEVDSAKNNLTAVDTRFGLFSISFVNTNLFLLARQSVVTNMKLVNQINKNSKSLNFSMQNQISKRDQESFT